jgi:hypothetical protein
MYQQAMQILFMILCKFIPDVNVPLLYVNAYNQKHPEFGRFEIYTKYFIPVCVLLSVFIWGLKYSYCIYQLSKETIFLNLT